MAQKQKPVRKLVTLQDLKNVVELNKDQSVISESMKLARKFILNEQAQHE